MFYFSPLIKKIDDEIANNMSLRVIVHISNPRTEITLQLGLSKHKPIYL
jgi:hypothetical protein